MDESKALKAVVVGGSMAGLCAGLVLRDAGCEVEIFEKSPQEMQERGAGLVVQEEVLNFVVKHCRASPETLGVLSRGRQFLARDGTVTWAEPSPQLMTSWNALHRHLKRAFPQPHYHHGARLMEIRQQAEQVFADFDEGREEVCGLLVCADGANSAARRLLLPEVAARYVGYVAWRGMVGEGDVAQWVREMLAGKFTFFHARHTQMLCYFVPGAAGETAAGARRINWVWYWNVPDGEELRELLTDSSGLIRDYSVPQGAVKPDLLRRQGEMAARVLPEVFQYLFAATREPFIQPIYDLSVPRMAFGRVCLLGDAAFVPRPHTAASTYKAFADAIALGGSLRVYQRDVAAALRHWEASQMKLGEYLSLLGQELGNRSQFGAAHGPSVVQGVARPIPRLSSL